VPEVPEVHVTSSVAADHLADSEAQQMHGRFNIFTDHTVDGRNPAPVDMENIPLFTGFYTSQVVQDFFHQRYHNT